MPKSLVVDTSTKASCSLACAAATLHEVVYVIGAVLKLCQALLGYNGWRHRRGVAAASPRASIDRTGMFTSTDSFPAWLNTWSTCGVNSMSKHLSLMQRHSVQQWVSMAARDDGS